MDPRDLLTELAEVFSEEQAARNLLDGIGFPRRRLPRFSNAEQFWQSAILELNRGIAKGVTFKSLVDAALAHYPANETFQAYAHTPEDAPAPTPDRRSVDPHARRTH